MKRHRMILIIVLIVLVGIGIYYGARVHFKEKLEADKPIVGEDIQEPQDPEEIRIGVDNYSNWHEVQNHNSIGEANAYAEKRLEKSYNVYLNRVFVDIGYDWDGIVFLPIRSIGEGLNWRIIWIPDKQMIQVVKGDEEAFVDVVNFFGKAYVSLDILAHVLNLDSIAIEDGKIHISEGDIKEWQQGIGEIKGSSFYIDDMKMTDAAYKLDEDIYIPSKIFAMSFGRIYRYNAEEGFITIDGNRVEAILIDGIPYSQLAHLEEIIDTADHSFSYDAMGNKGKKVEVVYKGPDKKRIALTFDDYIDAEVLPLLDVLDAHDVKGSFFIIGNTIDVNKDILEEIYNRGHIIANHTWDHLNNHSIPEDEFRGQLISTQLVIKKHLGIVPKYYRPPGGYYNSKMLKIARDIGLKTVMWSLNSNDASFDSKPAHITEQVLKNLSNGSIIVMHTKRKSTIEALPEIIKKARQQGYEFVGIDALIP